MNKTIDLNHYNPEAILAVKNSMPTVDHLIERAQVLIQNHGHIQPELINALFRIDMRGFERINDTCGYQVGDRLLVALFQALQGVCTTLDASHALARAGGDEFLVFIQAEEKHIGQFSTLLLDSLKTLDYRALGSEYPLEIYISGVENALYFNNDIYKLLELTSVGLPKAKALMVNGQAPVHIVSQGE